MVKTQSTIEKSLGCCLWVSTWTETHLCCQVVHRGKSQGPFWGSFAAGTREFTSPRFCTRADLRKASFRRWDVRRCCRELCGLRWVQFGSFSFTSGIQCVKDAWHVGPMKQGWGVANPSEQQIISHSRLYFFRVSPTYPTKCTATQNPWQPNPRGDFESLETVPTTVADIRPLLDATRLVMTHLRLMTHLGVF